MRNTADHIGNYNFLIEISGVAIGFARQVQGLEAIPNSATSGIGLPPGSPVNLSGLGTRFGGQVYITGVTHNVGGGNWSPPSSRLIPSQVKVILLGVVPANPSGATELLRWWGQKNSPQLGRRPVAIIQRKPSGRELRRHSMDGLLVVWQGPIPVPGRPDPPPEATRVELLAANLRLGR
jgi:hypothetical protein